MIQNKIIDISQHCKLHNSIRNVICGITRLVKQKTVSTQIHGKLMIQIVYSGYQLSGIPKDEAIEKVMALNKQLPNPVNSHKLRKELTQQDKVYPYSPDTVIKKLSLTPEEIRLSGMKQNAEKKKTAKKKASEKNQLYFELCKTIIISHEEGYGPSDIYQNLSNKLKEEYSLSRIKQIWRDFGLKLHRPAPEITADQLLRYQHNSKKNHNYKFYKSHVPTTARESARKLFQSDKELQSLAPVSAKERIKKIKDLLNKGQNILLLGGAGSGKSYIIKQLMSDKDFRHHSLIITPTGKAADQYKDACTVHSALNLQWRLYMPDEEVKLSEIPDKLNNPAINYVIIDEIGMVRADIMNEILKRVELLRNTGQQIQLICVGDFSQLTPVVVTDDDKIALADAYHGCYANYAPLWDNQHFAKLHLYGCRRVKADDDLNTKYKIALHELSYMQTDSLPWLNSDAISHEEVADGDSIYLCATNRMVDYYNNRYAMQFLEDLKLYQADKTGDWTGGTPNKEYLMLAPGMRVMTTVNDENGAYVNGSFGVIISLNKSSIDVKLDKTSSIVTINRYDYPSHVPGESFKQFPLAIAKALTVHKAQGMTLHVDVNIVIDGSCQPGLVYTALSRVADVRLLHILGEIRPEHVVADIDALRLTG